MDVSLPLRSLIPSLDADVLLVLSRSESAFGATQVARLTQRGSRSGTRKVLDRLAEHGLVIADPINRGYMYRLNRDHLLMPALLSAIAVRHELFARLTLAVEALDPAPIHASVFGSFARGDGGPESDIDLFIITPGDIDVDLDSSWQAQIRGLEDQVRAWTGNHLEVLHLDVERFDRAVAAGERIIDELRADAVTLSGSDIKVLTDAGPIKV